MGEMWDIVGYVGDMWEISRSCGMYVGDQNDMQEIRMICQR